MNKRAWKPWHQVTRLRPELKRPDFALTIFAASLYDAVMDRGPEIYREPAAFFAQTFATRSLQELAKDAILRLSGKSDRAVHQLELTYGGGKTHALLALRHLASDPDRLPDLPSVQEIVNRAGMAPPRARVACIPFDYLDATTGMEVPAPGGELARLKYPWSVLAWQVAGPDGLRVLGGADPELPPFTNVLEDLLALPARHGLGTLILMDEVLMWAHAKAGEDPVWQGRLATFFQCLTQAVARVPRCCLVASLLASDLERHDDTGRRIAQELQTIFSRESEVGIEPVGKEDVAEVLRRRFFEPDTIANPALFRPQVIAALQGIAALDERAERNRKEEEERYTRSYPFHPDLTEVLYARWSQLPSFQRARGLLRTFALALRDAEAWDDGPLAGVNVFLGAPDSQALSPAALELAEVAENQSRDARPDWRAVLRSELQKARDIQRDFSGLQAGRELEQAVFSVFLHSQPANQATARAQTPELMALLGAAHPDKIVLERALAQWASKSWYLDENAAAEIGADGRRQLPQSWRLGSEPNLNQMHDAARQRIERAAVDTQLESEIGKVKSLTDGALQSGARVHPQPKQPKDIEDDGLFHFAVLAPRAASDAGRPSAEARRFLEEHSGPDDPRIFRNSVVLVVPSRDGVELARERVRDLLAWQQVREDLRDQDPDFEAKSLARATHLASSLARAARDVPGAIRAAYCIAITRGADGEAQAFRLEVDGQALFSVLKQDRRARIQETPVSAEALAPEGAYDLWHEGETARRVPDLVEEFARNPRLPKMLRRQAIYDTLAKGCLDGTFVFRLNRAGDERTLWREQVPPGVMADDDLEAILPGAAALARLAPELLAPGALPQLWKDGGVCLQDARDYFAGGCVVQGSMVLSGQTYEVPVAIPAASAGAVESAVEAAVLAGHVALLADGRMLYREAVPGPALEANPQLVPGPKPLSVTDVLPESLPEAWAQGRATARSISDALAQRVYGPVAWWVVREALVGAYRAGWLTADAPLPDQYASAGDVTLRLPEAGSDATPPGPHPVVPPPSALGLSAQATVGPLEIQNLAEAVSEIVKAATDHNAKVTFRVTVELSGEPEPGREAVDAINQWLAEVCEGFRLS